MLESTETILVIVDVQGKLARIMAQTERLHQQLQILAKAMPLFGIPVLWLEQLPDKLGPTSEELATILRQITQPIAKEHFSGWQCNEFRQQLLTSGRKKVLLAGIETHICVYQTCCDLLNAGMEVHVIADAVDSRNSDNCQLGLQMMQQHGAWLTQTESLLFELQQQASGDRFRQLLSLIK
ncbi:isochorismatase family protein [Shewanella yunxiaonensis]|uniref:Isochorismatase family protein n=1 Tax=Shewanella yunxiaonensis TaxID=2829809 RepID=A0ABX7YV96_9GAMM|nr:isochorismatase family protein [Shewanella yunxiaonensis]QUN06565.1 isochorismatase family protein [Shewanella yunxiaonensis]